MLPIAGEPLHDGVVAFTDGVVVDVGPRDAVCGRLPGVAVRDLGDDAILMPGLVDAHCHLEWSCFGGVVTPRPFAEWLGTFLPLRALMDAGDHLTAARHGAALALAAGTTTLADSGPTGAGVTALLKAGLRGVVHLEAFGAMDDAGEAADAAAQVAGRIAELESVARGSGGRVEVGVSPHAPYSAGPRLWNALGRHAEAAGRRWNTHIAESPDEDDAILRRRGPLAELFAERGFDMGRWDGAGGSVARRMDDAGALRAGLVAAHCVRMGPDDAGLLSRRGVRVAHCPRSNSHLRCGTAPLAGLVGGGVTVGLGTDSPASGGDYDLRAEARACRDVHGADAPADAALVRLITEGAARALGMGDRAGAIAPGRPADLLVLRAAPDAGAGEPHAAVLDAATRVDLVMVDGVVLHGPDVSPAAAADATARAARSIEKRLRTAAGATPAADMP